MDYFVNQMLKFNFPKLESVSHDFLRFHNTSRVEMPSIYAVLLTGVGTPLTCACLSYVGKRHSEIN